MIRNETKGVLLAEEVGVADTFFGRLRGLLGRRKMRKGEALVIDPCSSIHTVGMRFTIDAIFLDKKRRVIGLCKSIKPFRFTRVYWNAKYVVELPDSSIERSGTDIGDEISIDELED
jgi:hypothetical protein